MKANTFFYPSFICAKIIKGYHLLQAFSRSTHHLTRDQHPFQLSLLLSKSSHRLYHCLCFHSVFVFVFVFVELDEISWNVIKGLRYFWLNGSLLYFIIGMYYVASFSTTHMYFHFLLSSIYFLNLVLGRRYHSYPQLHILEIHTATSLHYSYFI